MQPDQLASAEVRRLVIGVRDQPPDTRNHTRGQQLATRSSVET